MLDPIPSIHFTSRGIPREAASKHWSPGPNAAFSHEGAPANSTAAAATILWFAGANSLALNAVFDVALFSEDEEEKDATACLASGGSRQLASGSIGTRENERKSRE